MKEALVPIRAGVLSAIGIFVAPRGRRLSRTASLLLDDSYAQQLKYAFTGLEQQGCLELQGEGIAERDLRSERSVVLRYRGQFSTLILSWQEQS